MPGTGRSPLASVSRLGTCHLKRVGGVLGSRFVCQLKGYSNFRLVTFLYERWPTQEKSHHVWSDKSFKLRRTCPRWLLLKDLTSGRRLKKLTIGDAVSSRTNASWIRHGAMQCLRKQRWHKLHWVSPYCLFVASYATMMAILVTTKNSISWLLLSLSQCPAHQSIQITFYWDTYAYVDIMKGKNELIIDTFYG